MNRRLLPFQGWRLTLFQAVIFFSFVLLIIRLYDLQFMRGEELTLAAEENRLQLVPIAAPRGVIYDRYGQLLALNVPAFNVTIVPGELPEDPEARLDIYNRLSALVDVPPTRASADAAGRIFERSLEEFVIEGEGIEPFQAIIVAQDVPRETAMRILEERLDLPGVDVEVASVREYPSAALTAQVIGYLGPIPAEQAEALIEEGYNPAFDRIGYAGVEFFLEGELAGRQGSRLREVNVEGLPLRIIRQEDPIPGRNATLTLDLDLQAAAQEALERRINIVNADAGRIVTQSGVVIAMNPQTGEILSLVSFPTYDNSRFARAIDGEYYLGLLEDPLYPLINHAISSLYPPGSVWKLITSVGVLGEDVIDPAQPLSDPGQLVLPNRYAPNDPAASQTFVCWLREGHGDNVTLVNAIAWSCDVYFYQVGGGNPEVSELVLRPQGLGIDDLYRYATAFGIGSELGIELPGEGAGRMPDRDWKRRTYGENWSTGDTYNAAFGQGYVTVTPLQLITAISAIANGGTLFQPTLVHSFTDEESNVVEGFTPHVSRTLIRPASDEPAVLLMQEDMIIQGENSLVCTCEPDSEWYDAERCDPANYTATVDLSENTGISDPQMYTVNVPRNYVFNGSVCDENQFNPDYIPPFTTGSDLALVQQGMRNAVTVEGGTALAAALPYVDVAGKTGTAEYCDDIARPLGLCVPGNWPAHAWYVGYAPYEDPEIVVLAFVYNGDEGSLVALPLVREVMEEYFRLRDERQQSGQTPLP
ncbi:MAG: penicillin-binding protein 2 [Anaerolineae bacterium]|nr:penicillin-binding protein 2 [Anaerolineae bacterium]